MLFSFFVCFALVLFFFKQGLVTIFILNVVFLFCFALVLFFFLTGIMEKVVQKNSSLLL